MLNVNVILCMFCWLSFVSVAQCHPCFLFSSPLGTRQLCPTAQSFYVQSVFSLFSLVFPVHFTLIFATLLAMHGHGKLYIKKGILIFTSYDKHPPFGMCFVTLRF